VILCASNSAADALQALSGGEDGDLLESTERASEDGCVVRIAKLRLFDRWSFDGFGELSVARNDLGCGEVLLPELLAELRSFEDAGEFGEERLRGEEFEAAFAGELDQPLGRSTPKQR